jgi:hypothetical protein
MSEHVQLLLLIHAGSTFAMFGLIWFVQVVHYPLMSEVGEDGFAEYERSHTARTTWVVAPLMFLELGSASLLVYMLPDHRVLTIAGVIALGLIWGSTFLLQVPAHNRLTRGFDTAVHRRLVATNWVRTVLWSARSLLACVLLGMG